MALVDVEGLGYVYGAADGSAPRPPALTDCSLTVDAGESLLLVGPSGSGKSTLLRAIAGLVPHFHGGTITGRVAVAGRDTSVTTPADLASTVGFVFQDPEAQSVMATVDAEVVFGLENLGVAPSEMEVRTQEALTAMGISDLRERRTHELSSGELQRVMLAAVLAMQPRVLLLDEPTSQLDPVAAEALFALVRRINEETGLAVLVAEHRLDRCYGWADRVVAMENGRIAHDGEAHQTAVWALQTGSAFLPPVTRVFEGYTDGNGSVPLSVKEGHMLLTRLLGDRSFEEQDRGHGRDLPSGDTPGGASPSAPTHRTARSARRARRGASPAAVSVRGLVFAYPDGTLALRGCDLEVSEGECVAIVGENGAGKSTLVRHLNGLARPAEGSVSLFGESIAGKPTEELARTCGLVGQHPDDYLSREAVRDELAATMADLAPDADEEATGAAVADTLALMDLAALADADPRSLSAGERQRVALASVLVAQPRLLVLDEPTRGMDPVRKTDMVALLLRLSDERDVTVIVVTHDVEFAAALAPRTVVLARGRIVADGPTRDVMGRTILMSPQACRVMRDVAPDVLSVDEARAALASLLVAGGDPVA